MSLPAERADVSEEVHADAAAGPDSQHNPIRSIPICGSSASVDAAAFLWLIQRLSKPLDARVCYSSTELLRCAHLLQTLHLTMCT